MTYPQGQPWPDQRPAPYRAPGFPADPGPAPTGVRAVLWLVLAQTAVGLLLGLPAAYLNMDATLAQQPSTPGVDQDTLFLIGFVTAVVIAVVVYAVWVLFAVKLVQGRNWARITLLVLCGVSVLYTPVNLVSQGLMGTATALGVASAVVSLGFYVAISVLLFKEPAKSWTPAKTAFRNAQRSVRFRA